MNVLITLTEAGIDTGPFNLYSNVDTYSTPFETNISRGILIAGYTSQVVPTGTSTIRVKSVGTCTNYVDLLVITPTTTTTSTTAAPTTTTTTTAGGGPTTTTTTTSGGGPTTTTTTTAGGPTTTTTTTPYVGPSTTTTTTTSPPTTTTTTTSGGGSTTTTTSTSSSTTTTTTTSLTCYSYNAQNNNAESATIFWTSCDGTPSSEVVAPSAFSSTFCAREGSVNGFNFTINTIEPCSVPGPTTTTTTTTAAPPVTTTTTTTLQTYYQYALCTDSNVKYYTANSGYPSMILIAGQCFFGGSGTTSPEGTEFFANDGTCDCG